MKTLLSQILLSAILNLFVIDSGNAQPSKYAFLVGVGDYPEASGWHQLNAQNDVDLIKKTLLSQNFPEKNMLTLKDKAATKAGIQKQFQNQFLKKVKKGSTVVFSFSGHGQQVWDDNGDEIDGYDEALVPFDSKLQFIKGEYEGEQLLRDEELGEMLLKLRKKLGKEGHLFVLIDACHSGTSTRGIGSSRGTDVIMADSTYIRSHSRNVADQASLEENYPQLTGDIAPMVAFFSSSAQQLSYEYKGNNNQRYGLMTFAVCKAFTELQNVTTYQGLFDKVLFTVNGLTSRQTPQYEGELEQVVLGGQIIEGLRYFKVRKSVAPDLVVLDAGQLQGLNPGTEIVFYPIDTRDTASTVPIAKGVVDYAKTLDCDVLLDRSVKKEVITGAWAFVRKMNYGQLRATIQLQVEQDDLYQQLNDFLNSKSYLETVAESPDLLLIREENKLRLFNQHDRLIWESEANNPCTEEQLLTMTKSISSYLRAAFLRKLEVKNDQFATDIVLKAHMVERKEKGPAKTQFRIGEEAIMEITNQGEYGVYFSVINITPEDVIEPVIPFDQPANEYYLPPGMTYTFDTELVIGEPAGLDVMKIIATPEPLQLNKVIRTRGASTRNIRGISNPFEVLVSDLFVEENNTRGNTKKIPPGVGYISGVAISIIE